MYTTFAADTRQLVYNVENFGSPQRKSAVDNRPLYTLYTTRELVYNAVYNIYSGYSSTCILLNLYTTLYTTYTADTRHLLIFSGGCQNSYTTDTPQLVYNVVYNVYSGHSSTADFLWGLQNFSTGSCTFILYSKMSSKLTFQNIY